MNMSPIHPELWEGLSQVKDDTMSTGKTCKVSLESLTILSPMPLFSRTPSWSSASMEELALLRIDQSECSLLPSPWVCASLVSLSVL